MGQAIVGGGVVFVCSHDGKRARGAPEVERLQ